MTKDVKFDLLDGWSQEKAWWLGATYGDGNIYGRSDKGAYRVSIVCNLSTVQQWTALICPDAGIEQRTPNAWEGYIYSKRLVEWFAARDLVGKKSHRLVWPEDLPAQFYPDFLRGLWDTDGSVKIEKRRLKQGNDTLRAMFCAQNESFAQRVQDEVVAGSKVQPGKLIRQEKILSGKSHSWSTFKHTGAPAVLVCDYLYGDAPAHIRGESRYQVYRDYVDSRPEGSCRCGGEAWTEAMCRTCWWTKRRVDTPKKICQCGRDVVAKGMCLNCYKRAARKHDSVITSGS
jgi:hypothetical protein